jgi:hypothetical protein
MLVHVFATSPTIPAEYNSSEPKPKPPTTLTIENSSKDDNFFEPLETQLDEGPKSQNWFLPGNV